MTAMHRPHRDQPTARDAPGGFTLVELLVAAAIALAIMGTVASLFAVFGRSFSQSREISDLVGRMRSAAWKLRQDLGGVTVDMSAWVRPEANSGYFEIVEGTLKDATAAHGTNLIVADVDDLLMFTTKSLEGSFQGRLAGGPNYESPYAEVAWFCKPSARSFGGQTLYTLYRRQLLVSAYVGAGGFEAANTTPFTSWDAFFENNDLSCRRSGSTLFPNSLSDLTKRENRFLHNAAGTAVFPFPATLPTAAAATNGDILTGSREGEDVVLHNVIAFDVRVFDAESPIGAVSNYVDLGAGQATGRMSGIVNPKSQITIPTYDTWSMHYEFNGLDEDNSLGPDQGTNGKDDDGDNSVDEMDELETSPPNDAPLRGIEVRIRCVEPGSRQIRQVTVRHSFLSR